MNGEWDAKGHTHAVCSAGLARYSIQYYDDITDALCALLLSVYLASTVCLSPESVHASINIITNIDTAA